ncbi:glycosyltransferase family 2 protein [Belliella pelovolcani]|uniref:Glycosyltransferase involved in cell wall bisynthesis n=1 Tax=Belliella pelovolcani TaxID=529505 RepID=A0A1N7MEG2_9BACT|nr:glycosyltransferase family 2 protein [Belliella pelovolcani]SIS84428.1 Glycosyltransferase involved in cell wall bisynthesis [Belliella pelovolcani]
MVISIITVVFNGKECLEKTILSVLNQSYSNIEFIIIDGGSRDGTIDIIKKYENQLDIWLSEKDNGIYDAMNKGIRLSKGHYINFMNAGDTFIDNFVIEKFVTLCNKSDVVYGNYMLQYQSGLNKIIESGLARNLWKGSQFNHQATFVKSSLYKKMEFDIQERIVADFKFFYSVYIQGYQFQKLDLVVAKFLAGGVSDQNRLKVKFHFWSIVNRNWKSYLYYSYIITLTFFKVLVKKVLGTRLSDYIANKV